MDQDTIRRLHDLRAVALATTVLTRRDDLIIVEPDRPTGDGPDLHVRIDGSEQSSFWGWDVYLQPISSATPPPLTDPLWATLLARLGRVNPPPRPSCVILPGLRDDRAFFAWWAEPVVIDGSPRLLGPAPQLPAGIELTRQALDQIVGSVTAWALAADLTLALETPRAAPYQWQPTSSV